jgi:hypothetical protein
MKETNNKYSPSTLAFNLLWWVLLYIQNFIYKLYI